MLEIVDRHINNYQTFFNMTSENVRLLENTVASEELLSELDADLNDYASAITSLLMLKFELEKME